jgi:AraC-like DNA-binding protein
MQTAEAPTRVVYLFGAGASHACVQHVGSSHGTLMKHLVSLLSDEVSDLVKDHYQDHRSLRFLANDLITDSVDIEQIITFLDQSPSALHRDFAERLRDTFEAVLRQRFEEIELEIGDPPDALYYALIDMHHVPRFTEQLGGFLTLNYDSLLEHAIERYGRLHVDFCVKVEGTASEGTPIQVVKLHGSFAWEDRWPIATSASGTLWIPPGIQKAKDRYPFNMLWGGARELLECDVLRVVGCSLSANDWDLISLLFTAQYTRSDGRRFHIEIIDTPRQALALQRRFPYLGVQSVLEHAVIGPQLLAELLGNEPRTFDSLADEERRFVLELAEAEPNWFLRWLRLKAEVTYRDLGSISTDNGAFERVMTAA